jgi:GNAT superfamily N-acetyltransferase
LKRRPERGLGGIDLRPVRPEDLAVCTEVWSSSIGDYARRLNQPWFGGDPEPLRRLLAHFLRTDPDRFWVAAELPEGRVIGFGSATHRGSVLFLGMLFLEPRFQGRGIGTALLERVMVRPPAPAAGLPARDPSAATPADELTFATATDSVQPISAALYSRYRMVPRLPVLQVVGRPRDTAGLARLPNGVRVVEATPESGGSDAVVGRIDAAVLGHEHPVDHAFLRSEVRRLFLLESERNGVVGYGYVAPSGRFGPLAALDAGLLAPLALELMARVRAAGAYAIWVPGAADELVVALLEAGLRFESFPALLSWTRPFADFSRYVPINLALL